MSQSKLLTNIKNTIFLLFAIIIIYTVSFVVSWIIKLTTKNKGINTRLTNLISIISTLLSSFYTLYLWLIRNQGYDSIKLFIPIVFINALIYIVKNGNRVNDLYVEITGIIVSLFVFANIMFISNVPLNNNLTFLLIGLPFAILIISQKTSTPITNAITLNLFITILVGTLFTTMSSTTGNNIFDCNSRFEFGPAKGIIAHEEIVRFYNSEFENFKKYTDDKSVLIVTSPYNNTLMDIFYLENVNISHYSVNSTPTYSQKLYDYWNMFEEKIPDVIVVNNTAVYTWEHDFIFNYLETWYNARFVINTDNCTYYIK